ncbi:uncharacterized protein LOC118602774 [Rousettus aegyptiacus]|uniref:uncharacterized protein LOC118602774 n=1 Tax=Rousettus aegyptiacus TaxID=9407 RepID=UPI00168D5325|nr:uncharacterized protein LOC118602774 [Rousettus aegyptiacus]
MPTGGGPAGGRQTGAPRRRLAVLCPRLPRLCRELAVAGQGPPQALTVESAPALGISRLWGPAGEQVHGTTAAAHPPSRRQEEEELLPGGVGQPESHGERKRSRGGSISHTLGRLNVTVETTPSRFSHGGRESSSATWGAGTVPNSPNPRDRSRGQQSESGGGPAGTSHMTGKGLVAPIHKEHLKPHGRMGQRQGRLTRKGGSALCTDRKTLNVTCDKKNVDRKYPVLARLTGAGPGA